MSDLRDRLDAAPPAARWAVAVGAVALAWRVAAILLPSGAPVGRVVSGAVLGSATALTAMGLILIYRANRVINFAYGAMGAATGFTAVRFFLIWGWPYPAVLVGGLVSGVAMGFAVEFVVIRRFRNSSRLVLSVATIGLSQALGGIELFLPDAVFGKDKAVTLGGYETPLSRLRLNIGTDVIDGNHVLIMVVVPLVVAALAWFLKRSSLGTAVRAAAENADRARLLGIPVRRIHSVVWSVAGGLATLTFLLKAPFSGTPPTAISGPAILLPALAAALVAGMESLPVACFAAVVLGAVDQVTRWNTTSPTLSDVILLVVILGALLLRRRSTSRAQDAESTWQDAAAVRPIRRELRVLPAIRWAGPAVATVAVAALVVVPLHLSASNLFTLSIACVWGMVGLSLVVLTGWNGQISLGQFAFVGVGAVVAGNLMARWDVDLFISIAAAAAVSAVVALVLGIPALRIRGPFLGVVTLSFAVVLDGYILNPNVFPSLIPDSVERPVLIQRWPLEQERTAFWLCATFLVLVLIGVRAVRRSRSGRLLIAARDNRRAAEAMGVATRRTALAGFVFAGSIAGVAGALEAMLLHGIRVGSFPASDSVDVFSWTTIGGLTSPIGAVAGSSGLRAIRDHLPDSLRLLLSGVGLLVILLVLPGGFAQFGFRIRDRWVAWVARRHGIVAAVSDDGVRPSIGGQVANDTTTAYVSAHGVEVSYGQLQVLFGVDLEVARGEVVALLGTNGAGKSTVLRAMVGLVPSRGSFRVGGRDLGSMRTEQIAAAGIALMSGGKSTFPTLTVAEHLRLATWTFRHDHERIREDTSEVLDLFESLRRRLDNLAGDLSGGEQQQLALAQTLLMRPNVVLIDELSLGLSPTIVAQLLEVVRQMNAAGTTIVVVEQSVNVALGLADRAVFMEKGQVRFVGPTRDLLDRPDILRSVFLDGAGAQPHADDGDGLSEDDALAVLRAVPPEHGAVLDCVGITKRFGGVVAVDGVDLTVGPGEIVGLIGQNGAGKTTLLDCVSGFLPIDGGHVVFRGHDVTEWSTSERALSRMGRSFQEARLFPSLTVAETVAVAREGWVGSRSMVADATGQPVSHDSEAAVSDRVDELVALLGLTDYQDQLTSELSTGTRRIVELACLLAEEPVLLLLDEPSAGVAQRETEVLGPLLRRIRDATGVSMLVIEHDVALLSGLCDRLVAMETGAVVVDGPPAAVLGDERVIATYLGTDRVAIERSGVAGSVV